MRQSCSAGPRLVEAVGDVTTEISVSLLVNLLGIHQPEGLQCVDFGAVHLLLLLVPWLSIISCLVIPTPLSWMVRVLSALSVLVSPCKKNKNIVVQNFYCA